MWEVVAADQTFWDYYSNAIVILENILYNVILAFRPLHIICTILWNNRLLPGWAGPLEEVGVGCGGHDSEQGAGVLELDIDSAWQTLILRPRRSAAALYIYNYAFIFWIM